MTYHSKHSDVYHKYEKCVVGNNIEKDNWRAGPSKKPCKNCKDIASGKVKR